MIIATGGFEWNSELVRTFLRGPMNAPAGSPENTGDGLQMAMNVGANREHAKCVVGSSSQSARRNAIWA